MVLEMANRNRADQGRNAAVAEETAGSNARNGVRGLTFGQGEAALSPNGAQRVLRTGQVTAGTLNVRDAANGQRIGAVNRGDTVEIVGEATGWLQIKFGAATGWVSGEFVASRDPDKPHRPMGGTLRGVYDANETRAATMKVGTSHNAALEAFAAHFKAHKARYDKVAAKVDLPAPLIAAIHWRESTGDFGTYLHQGDPLGAKAVRVPKNIPLFSEWEPAAIHALNMKDSIQRQVALTQQTKDLAAITTYAEAYNGLGYRDRGVPSPYAWAGTDKYNKGKYVADGRYDANHKDGQPGVAAMVKKTEG